MAYHLSCSPTFLTVSVLTQSCSIPPEAPPYQVTGAEVEQALILPAHLQLHEGMLGEHADHGPVHAYSCLWGRVESGRGGDKGGCGCSETNT